MVCSARASNESLYAWQKLIREAIGSPNVLAPFAAGGLQGSLQALEEAPVTLVIGSDLTVENPVAATYVKRAVKAGRRLIVVDQRETPIAEHATLHLRARPGTEATLVNGLIRAVLARRADADAGALGEAVASETPEAVEAATGVACDALAAAVDLLDGDEATQLIYGAAASPAIAQFMALQGILGNIEREGGGVHHVGAQANSLGAVYMGLATDLAPGGGEKPAEGLAFDQLIANLAHAEQPQVRCLLISGENLAHAAEAVPDFTRALERVEHLVVIDSLEHDTMQYATVVLPAAAWSEEDGTVVNAEHRIQRYVQATPPRGEARTESWIATQIANRLGAGWPERSVQQWWEQEIVPAIPALSGLDYDHLGTDGALWPGTDCDRPGARIVPWVGGNYVHRTLIENSTGVLESLPQYSGLGEQVPADSPTAIREGFAAFLAEEELTDKAAAIDAVLAEYQGRRGGLIPVLQQVQGIVGFLPPAVQNYIALGLDLSAAAVYGVTSFYSFFSMTPRGKHIVRVCLGTACYVVGAGRIIEQLSEHLDVAVGETTSDRLFSLEGVRCVGACGLAPVVIVDEDTHGAATYEKMRDVLDRHRSEEA